MRIDGPAARQLSEALLDAFSPERLDEMLYFRLSKVRARITMADNYETRVFQLIRAADSEGWLDRLVIAARQSRPAHPGLFEAAQGLQLAVETGDRLESILNTRAPQINPAQWRAQLGALEAQVCRLEVHTSVGSRPLGTGFLVGPDLCMTSYHVVRDLHLGNIPPEDLRLRFDYKWSASGSELFPGTLFRLAADWAAVSAPYGAFELGLDKTDEQPSASELDFSVLRVAEDPGMQPLGGTGEPAAARRGWIGPPSPARPQAGDDILVLQHILGEPMRLAFGQVTQLNSNGTRISHTVNTDKGSSGSPCFTISLQLSAIHQAGAFGREPSSAPAYNQAVPIHPIQTMMARHGLSWAGYQA
jgi:hypothetical protein